MSDEALVQSAQRGDLDAFEALVRLHEQPAFRLAYLLTRDEADAADAAQEAMIKAYSALRRFDPSRSFRPWLLRIVTNEALNAVKARGRRRTLADRQGALAPQSLPGPEARVAEEDEARRVRAAVDQLREDDRAVIYLRYFMELSESELADALGCRPGTVKSRLHRALARLRDIAGHEFAELAPQSVAGARRDAPAGEDR